MNADTKYRMKITFYPDTPCDSANRIDHIEEFFNLNDAIKRAYQNVITAAASNPSMLNKMTIHVRDCYNNLMWAWNCKYIQDDFQNLLLDKIDGMEESQ